MIMLICALDLKHINYKSDFCELNNTTSVRRASGLFKIKFHITGGMLRNSWIHHNVHLILHAEVNVYVVIAAIVDLPGTARDDVFI